MTIKVSMHPAPDSFHKHESGIRRVVEAYDKYLPRYDVQVTKDNPDIIAVHAGTAAGAHVAHCHGLYWTADYPAAKWEWKANQYVLYSATHARQLTVPSKWVAETFARDMRLNPTVIGHGIDVDQWENDGFDGFVLWNKNRAGVDVCDPYPVTDLALRYPNQPFITTFSRPDPVDNIKTTGLLPHDQMRKLIQRCDVYLSTTKETFGIGTLEAMASGKPVLGFRHGGNIDLVQHGVNGYLASVNDFDDLAAGLTYCLKNKRVLGENGRQLAKSFTWDKMVEKVAGVYHLAMRDEPPTVDIVIPVYNKEAKELYRAASSAANQDGGYVKRIVIVDDGSDEEHVSKYKAVAYEVQTETHAEVIYTRKTNGGVATARNHGIGMGDSKYIVCLDSDDKIRPLFVQVCVEELEKDRSLGVAFTGLEYIKPNGERGISPWPDDYDFNGFLRGQNQVPTACVFRREMWRRLGGYKQRYAPRGAGSEDAEFWLRAGAYGWNAKKVTKTGLFVYSWMSGIVSGAKDYREVDWRAWHPWTKDEQHPMASMATPKGLSHPVRQYDEPIVSVIIPVGPGHENDIEAALDSLEAQTFRKWEAVVVMDTPDKFDKEYAYPYVRWFKTDEPGSGAGVARNIGADNARAPMLLFLDADDLLIPEALQQMMDTYEMTGKAVYSDYYGRAIVDDETKLAANLQENIVSRERNNEVMIRYSPRSDYDCERASRQPDSGKPYIWNNITTLIPTTWHDEIGGFDEEMPTWEDVDYWWRMAWAGKCFHRIREPLMVYKMYAGHRREHGIRNYATLKKYLSEKKKDITLMGCGCKQDKVAMQDQRVGINVERRATEAEMSDDDYVMVKYMSPNKGQHGVRGAATRQYYGYRGGGDQFLVHRSDVAAQPHMFDPIVSKVTTAARRIEAPEPAPIQPQPEQQPMPEFEYEEDEEFDVQLLPGVTPTIAERLKANNLTTKEALIEMGAEELSNAIVGIGQIKAELIIAYLTEDDD